MTDQKPMPDEVLAKWDSPFKEWLGWLKENDSTLDVVCEALREAIQQRDEARSLVRAYVDPMDTHAEDEAALKACGVVPDYCEDMK